MENDCFDLTMELDTGENNEYNFADVIDTEEGNQLILNYINPTACEYYFDNEYSVSVTNCICSQSEGMVSAEPDENVIEYLNNCFSSHAETIMCVNDIDKMQDMNITIIFPYQGEIQDDALYDIELNMTGYMITVYPHYVDIMLIFTCSGLKLSSELELEFELGTDLEPELELELEPELDLESKLNEGFKRQVFEVYFKLVPNKMIINEC